MKIFTGYHEAKQCPCLVSIDHAAHNKQGLWDRNPLSSAQQKHWKPQTPVHCYLQ